MDVGGTFTDVVAVNEETGTASVLKVPTEPLEPHANALAAVDAAAERGETIDWIGHATTIATNVLLGQIGLRPSRVVLVTTEGFRDVIEIGRQNRSRVYDLFVERPKMLVARDDRLTVRERIDYRGSVLDGLDESSLSWAVLEVRERMPASVAICLLHSYVNPTHERSVAARLLGDAAAEYVYCSADVDPQYREYERFSTTVVTAALGPIVAHYLNELVDGLRARKCTAPLFVMRSDGGLSDVATVSQRPSAIIESGPAGGVIAAAHLSRALGVERALSLDMGGTTAKAGTILGAVPEVVTEFEAAGATHSGRSVKGSGYPVRLPFVDLCEVSAGGGTIAWLDDANSLRVGPTSAGADPGPACYGRSDRATVTDANVVLGRLNPKHLLGGAFPIDRSRSIATIAGLARQTGSSTEQIAEGIVALVDAQMAKALRIVTVERGLDPRQFTLVAFGGGGPLHACALAAELGVERILVPANPGLFSTEGLLVANLLSAQVRPLMCDAGKLTEEEATNVFSDLEQRAASELRRQGAAQGAISFRRTCDARYRGQSFELSLDYVPGTSGATRRFHDLHRMRYGYAAEEETVEFVNARVVATAPRRGNGSSWRFSRPLFDCKGTSRQVWCDGRFVEVPVLSRAALDAGSPLLGPALVEQYDCTTYVAPGWTSNVLDDGTIDMRRSG